METRDTEEGRNKAFPPEYAHIGEMVNEAQQRIRQIDEQIKNAPHDREPSPQYNPPGFLRRHMGSREQNIDSWEKQKDQIRADLVTNVDKQIVGADPKTARIIRDHTREAVYRNPFEGKDAAEMERSKAQSKDLEASQDFADVVRKGGARQEEGRQDRDALEQTNLQTDKEPEKPFSMSLRFSQSLNYMKEAQKEDSTPEKSPEPDKGEEDMNRG